MKRMRWTLGRGVIVALVAVVSLATLHSQSPANAHRIAVFGSSVAFGTGDELGKEGYTGRLRALLEPRGWQVLNQSRGGDNTVTMAPRFSPDGEPKPNTRYLVPVDPRYVLLGLSLGNEGIANVKTKEEKEQVFRQFESGMHGFIDRSRQQHIVPIVTSCYTRMDFTDVEYEYTRRMNLLINSWNVPSVNFLGAVDDGTGKWAKGFWHDSLHPNASGHDELTTTFVPSLFEALDRGKAAPMLEKSPGFARFQRGTGAITFSPADKIHPFALVFRARTQSEGIVASVAGITLDATTETKTVNRGGDRPPMSFESTTLSAGQPFVATIRVKDGKWQYESEHGWIAALKSRADSAWHTIALSHYTARGETLFYVDGELAGRISERLEPKRFVLGGPGNSANAVNGAKQVDLKDVMVYRSALNADEISAIGKGTFLQSSLELYAPLVDSHLDLGAMVENRAQSLSSARVEGGAIIRLEK